MDDKIIKSLENAEKQLAGLLMEAEAQHLRLPDMVRYETYGGACAHRRVSMLREQLQNTRETLRKFTLMKMGQL